MFHQGDLQSGIDKAVQESKLVACFVTDDGEESNKWEHEFLEEPSLKASLSEQTILLRLKADSQEAGYLAAIFPLPKTPTLVLIKNGDLKEYLAAGINREEFLRRMGNVLGSPVADSPATQYSQPTAPTTTTSNDAVPSPISDQSSQETQPIAAPSSSQQSGVSSSTRTQQSSSDLLAERMARLVKQKKEKDQEKQKESKGKGKAPAESPEKPSPSTPTSSAPTADMKYAQMQRKRQQEEKDERARILKRVEDDKAQRRQDAAERKAKAQANATPTSETTGLSSNRSNHPAKQSAECAVQVRLFDGSTIRSRFPSQGSLRANVRPWIDEKQEGGIPYGFKQVLTPLPNKNISISEEEESLQELGLTPSATLILMPISDFASAYEGGGAAGLVYKGAAAGYNLVSTGIGMVTGVLGSLLGGGAAPAQEPQQTPAATTTSSSSINVRTLRDQQRPDDQQFYNGNALNFEPRRDDDDKKDD